MDTLANKQKAIFITNISNDMHSHSFLNSTQFEDILNFVCFISFLNLFICLYMYQEYDQ